MQQNQGGTLRIDRDLLQIDQYAQKLLARSSMADGGTVFDANRLLASEGLDPALLRRMTQAYELKPRPEAVLAPEAAHTVGEFVERTQQALTLATMSRAGSAVTSAFDRFLDATADEEWAADCERLFDRTAPLGMPALALAGAIAFPGDRLGGPRLSARAAAYAAVARRMVRGDGAPGGARLSAAGAAVACREACERNESEGVRRATMRGVWALVAGVLGGAGVAPGETALVRASRACLEAEFAEHMRTTVRSHRGQAALGGAPSRLALVNAYLRVRLAPARPDALDFDAPGRGSDTTWARMWTCLRAGFVEEALALAQASPSTAARSLPLARGAGESPVVAALRALADEAEASGPGAPPQARPGAALRTEAERSVHEAQRGAALAPFAGHRLAVLALLARHDAAAEAVAALVPAALPTIEDFLWLRLGMAQGDADAAGLRDLRQFLLRYPATHYTQDGREPLQYVRVLLLAGLFTQAVAFLAQDASTRPWRLDAVYLCAVLARSGSPAFESGPDDAPARLVRQYARELLPIDVQAALDHYMLAADVAGGSIRVRGSLLRELLVESRAFRELLLPAAGGAGGPGASPLALLFPDEAERRRVVEAVAADCAAAGQADEAVELYAFCDRPETALDVLCRRVVEEAVSGATAARGATVERGDALAGALRDGTRAGSSALEAWGAAKAGAELLAAAAAGDTQRALLRLNELPFLPTEPWRVEACAARTRAGGLHPALAAALPRLVLAAAGALAAAKRGAALGALTSYASALASRFSQGDFKELSALNAGLD